MLEQSIKNFLYYKFVIPKQLLVNTNTRSLPTKQINYILHMLNVSYIFLVNIGNELMFFLDFKTSSSLLLKSLILRIWEYSCCCCARRKFFQGTMLLVIRHCCGLVYMSPSLHLSEILSSACIFNF